MPHPPPPSSSLLFVRVVCHPRPNFHLSSPPRFCLSWEISLPEVPSEAHPFSSGPDRLLVPAAALGCCDLEVFPVQAPTTCPSSLPLCLLCSFLQHGVSRIEPFHSLGMVSFLRVHGDNHHLLYQSFQNPHVQRSLSPESLTFPFSRSSNIGKVLRNLTLLLPVRITADT